MEREHNTTGKGTYSPFDSTLWSEIDLERNGNLVAVAIPFDNLDDASTGPISIRQDMKMGCNMHHQGSEQRRRSSTTMCNNFINEMGSGYNPDGTERRCVMEQKRTSLDVLVNEALAVYNQEHQIGSTAASGQIGMGSIDTPSRSSLYSLVTGDSTLGRRDSLTHILVASEFAKPSRRSSMATGTEPVDPFQAKVPAVRLGSGLVGFPNNHNSELGFPNSQNSGPPDKITLQLLQQQNTEEEHALSSNDDDYIHLQKLQTMLRRTSISNILDEITRMH